MRSNRLQVNPSKTELLWCSSSRRQHQIPTRLCVSATLMYYRSLPFVISGSTWTVMSAYRHVTATVRSCFAALRQIRSVRLCLPRHALLSLIRALVVSKVEYCCPVLAISCCTGCSPCSSPLLDLYSPSGFQSASLRFSVSFTGCGFWNG